MESIRQSKKRQTVKAAFSVFAMLSLGSSDAFIRQEVEVVGVRVLPVIEKLNHAGVWIHMKDGHLPLKYLKHMPLSPQAKQHLKEHGSHLIELPASWKVTGAAIDNYTGTILIQRNCSKGIAISLVELKTPAFESIETATPLRAYAIQNGRLCLVCEQQVMIVNLHDRSVVSHRIADFNQFIPDRWKHGLWVEQNAVLLSCPLTLSRESKKSELAAAHKTDGVLLHWTNDAGCSGLYLKSDVPPSGSYRESAVVIHRFGTTLSCSVDKLTSLSADQVERHAEVLSTGVMNRMKTAGFVQIDNVADITAVSIDEWCVSVVSCSDPTLVIRAIGVGCGMVYLVYSRVKRPLEMAFVSLQPDSKSPTFPAQPLPTSSGTPYYMVVHPRSVDIHVEGDMIDRYRLARTE